MPKARPFAYNYKDNPPIEGTIQVGSLAVGAPITGFTNSPQFWNGPDEEQGYVIAIPVPDNTQPTPVKLTLSQTYKGIDVSLSNNNQTAHQNFGYQQSVLGETLIGTTDKVMFSVVVNLSEPGAAPDSHFIGIGYTSMNYQGNPYGGFPGNDDQSVGYSSSGKIWYNGTEIVAGLETWGNSDRIDIVIDNNNNAMWVRKNGGEVAPSSTWNNNPTADPTTNTGGIEIIGGPFYPVLCPGYEGTMTILNTAIYGVPTGFTFIDKLTASIKFIGTKYQTNPFDDSTFIALVNKYFNQTFSNATLAGVWLTNEGYWHSYKDGRTPQTAGDSALQIKTNFPGSVDNKYWIVNGNISGGTPFEIYADMTTDGGGWTLLVRNQNTTGWTYENSVLLNENNVGNYSLNYSIVSYADYIKDTGPTFQYMLDAYERGRFGGIWTAPQSYSFVYTANTQTDITLDIKFGTWNYNDSSIEQYMPWRSTSSGLLTTSSNPGGQWWGTLITNGGWDPAPWINGDCGAEGCMPAPGIIWYWVR
jgi:hypothetical protein